jgi:hypothetical protein
MVHGAVLYNVAKCVLIAEEIRVAVRTMFRIIVRPVSSKVGGDRMVVSLIIFNAMKMNLSKIGRTQSEFSRVEVNESKDLKREEASSCGDKFQVHQCVHGNPQRSKLS